LKKRKSQNNEISTKASLLLLPGLLDWFIIILFTSFFDDTTCLNNTSPLLGQFLFLQLFIKNLCCWNFTKISLPRHQITFLESVGGSVEQQKQSLEGLQASTLKPPNFPLSLTLLLTSETTKGAFDTFIQACRIEVVAFCLSAHI
jgi:hypothetical protein